MLVTANSKLIMILACVGLKSNFYSEIKFLFIYHIIMVIIYCHIQGSGQAGRLAKDCLIFAYICPFSRTYLSVYLELSILLMNTFSKNTSSFSEKEVF